MPQKACERFIFHVIAYAFFRNSPSHFRFLFGSKPVTCLFLESPTFNGSKIRHFKVFENKKYGQRTENEYVEAFQRKMPSHDMSFFTCFLGHFMVHPPPYNDGPVRFRRSCGTNGIGSTFTMENLEK